MKNENNFRTSLGFNQEELALLLQVSRSQLSLYELGKRSLPTHALEKLAILLKQAQRESTKSVTKKTTSINEQKFLQRLQLKNKHQQLLVERKIKAFEKKQKALESSKKILSFLMQDNTKTTKSELDILKSIATKAKKKEQQNSSINLLVLQLKKEVLAYEEKLLLKKLKNK